MKRHESRKKKRKKPNRDLHTDGGFPNIRKKQPFPKD